MKRILIALMLLLMPQVAWSGIMTHGIITTTGFAVPERGASYRSPHTVLAATVNALRNVLEEKNLRDNKKPDIITYDSKSKKRIISGDSIRTRIHGPLQGLDIKGEFIIRDFFVVSAVTYLKFKEGGVLVDEFKLKRLQTLNDKSIQYSISSDLKSYKISFGSTIVYAQINYLDDGAVESTVRYSIKGDSFIPVSLNTR